MRPLAFFCIAAFAAACTKTTALPIEDMGVDLGPDMALPVNATVGLSACLNLASCLGGSDGVSNCTKGIAAVNSKFISSQVHISAAMVQCFAAATTCDGVRACLNGGVSPAPCATLGTACSGSKIIGCVDGVGAGGSRGTTSFDCADVGLTCVAGNNTTDCGIGSCVGFSASCVSSQVQFCMGGILRGIDCAEFNASCTAQSCVGSGSACSVDGGLDVPTRCDGTRLVFCLKGQEGYVDCAALGQSCVPNIGGEAAGCAGASECDSQSFTDSCTGTSLSFCNAGRLETVDCVALGFTNCGTSGPGGIARCTR